MRSGELLNGCDRWNEAVCEAWAHQWWRAEVEKSRYTWGILATELYRSGKSMGCETQKFLAEIARTRADMIGESKQVA